MNASLAPAASCCLRRRVLAVTLQECDPSSRAASYMNHNEEARLSSLLHLLIMFGPLPLVYKISLPIFKLLSTVGDARYSK